MENSPTSPTQNYTPLPSVKKGHPVGKKTIALILGIGVLAISGFALLLMNMQQKSSLTGKAVEEPPECHNGLSPLGADPSCRENGSGAPAAWNDGGWKSCTAPAEGTCKMKGACYECRYRFAGLKTICPCIEATPTPTIPIVEKPRCEPPFQCLPPELCVPDTLQKPSLTKVGGTADQTNVGGAGLTTVGTTKPGTSSDACTPGTYCCVKRQPTPTPSKPTPSISQCPAPGLVQDIKITCPLCNKQP